MWHRYSQHTRMHACTYTCTQFGYVSVSCVHTQQVIASLCHRIDVFFFTLHLSARASRPKGIGLMGWGWRWRWGEDIYVVLLERSSHHWPLMTWCSECVNQRCAEERWLMRNRGSVGLCGRVCGWLLTAPGQDRKLRTPCCPEWSNRSTLTASETRHQVPHQLHGQLLFPSHNSDGQLCAVIKSTEL